MPIGSCEFCGSVNVQVKTTQPPNGSVKPPVDLCVLCYYTPARDAFFRPEQHPNADVIQTICYASNAIMQSQRHIGEHPAPLDAVIDDIRDRAQKAATKGMAVGAKVISEVLSEDDKNMKR